MEAPIGICKKCGTEKPRVWRSDQRKLNGGFFAFLCGDCNRAKDRERGKTPSTRARKAAACKKYRKTPTYSAWVEGSRDVIKQKEKARLFQRAIGSTCHIWPIKCFSCNTPFVSRNDGHVICPTCKPNINAYWYFIGEKIQEGEKRCNTCDKPFYSFEHGATATYCSGPCREKGIRANRKKARRTRKHLNGNHLDRARWHGVRYEPVDRAKVFARDRWRCASCGTKVVRSKEYRPDQATIDHIIPMAKGGPHTYTNVTTMCMACNSRKRDVLQGQLRITI
jgi:5-methylcytosine-specific restriction endonuclease McrA